MVEEDMERSVQLIWCRISISVSLPAISTIPPKSRTSLMGNKGPGIDG